MGTLASAKIIPMMDKQTDPEPVSVEAKLSAVQTSDTPAPVATELAVPEPEPIPTVSLRKVFLNLLGYVTRERIITKLCYYIYILIHYLVWYLGNKSTML